MTWLAFLLPVLLHRVPAVVIRTSLVPFGCTTKNGVSTLNADASIQCNSSNSSYSRMFILGSVSIVLYGVGLPCLFGYFLWRHRVAIECDQRLRMRGEGETSLTNPYIVVRRRFRKLYEDYKPEYRYWKLVLISRKLALAVIGILLTGNPTLQVFPGSCTNFQGFLLCLFRPWQ